MTTTIFGRTCAMNHWIVTTACMLLMVSGATLAADYEAGQKKAKEVCAACHGEDGNKPLTPETPRLAGQYYDYLEHSLKAYRSGARENPLMSPMAKPLSDKDIKDVAWYFSKQQGLASKY